MSAPRPAALLCIACFSFMPTAVAQDHEAGDVVLTPGTVENFGRTYDVEFGTLWVPMNRSDASSGLIELSFTRYKSPSPDPRPALIYLAGGPGGSGLGSMRSSRAKLFLALLDERDFIAFDQRGTGQSQPDNLVFDLDVDFPLDEPGDPDRYTETVQGAARSMLAEMKARGVDVRGLTTAESADDIETLRVALGADKFVLWGSSYGTHLALATVRRHPDAVAAVILAGTEGPDHTFKLPGNIQTNLERLSALVAKDPVYAEKMPDLTATLKGILDDLERNPRTVALLPDVEVTVGKWDLQKALSSPMGSRGGMQEAPAALYKMAHGEFFDLARWALEFRRPGRRSAMSIVMDCSSYGSAERLALIEDQDGRTLLGAAIDYPFPCLCEVAGMPRLPDEFRAPLHSDVPALFISGTLDGRTPVSNGQEIAAGFTNHQQLVIRNASHGGDLFTSTPAVLESVRAFLAGETLPASEVDGPEWEFDPPFARSLVADMLGVLTTEGYEAAVARYTKIRAEFEGKDVYDFREEILNVAGYELARAGMIDLAIDLFRLNTVAWPEAFNTWDSLGEGYMEKGELDKAIANYERSLQLNPDNANAVQMIERIRSRQ